ncbi:MAG: membrane-bound lytic murein transglycosylase F [Gammaproteobacteria bacterium]|jgi:membrane-bound lytic murein transglycosylase F
MTSSIAVIQQSSYVSLGTNQSPPLQNSSSEKIKILKILQLSPAGVSVISNKEKSLLSQFALAEGLVLETEMVSGFSELISKIEAGEADLVASLNNDLLKSIQGRITNTLPWAISKHQVIGRADSNTQNNIEDLFVRQVALKVSSPAWKNLSNLAVENKSMELLKIPEEVSVETILKRVKSGQYDLVVLDSLSLPVDLEFNYNLRVSMDLSDESFMTWGVRPESVVLLKTLNKFLSKKHLESGISRSYRQDFPSIKQRKLLRLITYQSPVNYYYDRGRFKGFEYDLIKKFAETHGMRLDVVIADTHKTMLELLGDGKGDLIAASAPENNYITSQSVKVSAPYNYASAVLVGRDDDLIVDVRDLQGRTIHLPLESPYKEMLSRIKRQGVDITILETGTELNTESVLFNVAQGIFDLTVISSHEVKAELSRQLNLKAHFNLGEPQPFVWVVRHSNTLLLSALNEFISTEYRKGYYNVTYARYIKKPNARITNSNLFAQVDQLSPYDEIVHKYADYYGFDWRLIVAQMYQESRFNPRAISDAGAGGLMQILPSTAQMIGIEDLYDPENSIGGGIRYMNYLMGLFEDDLNVEDKIWFTLASYNAGYSRVKRARELAEILNLDKNKWFNNVETALLKLNVPYKKNGIEIQACRCGQAASYVREIRTIYNNYLRLTQSVKAASREDPENEES